MKKINSHNSLYLSSILIAVIVDYFLFYLSKQIVVNVNRTIVWRTEFSYYFNGVFLILFIIWVSVEYYKKKYLVARDVIIKIMSLCTVAFLSLLIGIGLTIDSRQFSYSDKIIWYISDDSAMKTIFADSSNEFKNSNFPDGTAIVFFKKGCPYCQVAISYLLDTMKSRKNIVFVNAASEEGEVLTQQLGVSYVPSVVLYDGNENNIVSLAKNNAAGQIVVDDDGFSELFRFNKSVSGTDKLNTVESEKNKNE